MKPAENVYRQMTMQQTTISFLPGLKMYSVENQLLMEEMFNAKPTVFKPTIPNLVYQYEVYTNCCCCWLDDNNQNGRVGCTILNKRNSEIHHDDDSSL